MRPAPRSPKPSLDYPDLAESIRGSKADRTFVLGAKDPKKAYDQLLAVQGRIRNSLHQFNGGRRGIFGGSSDPSTSVPTPEPMQMASPAKEPENQSVNGNNSDAQGWYQAHLFVATRSHSCLLLTIFQRESYKKRQLL